MDKSTILKLAGKSPVYDFGSEALDILHRENFDSFRCEYKSGVYFPYVVFHKSARGGQSFKTLNIIRGGDRVPYIYEI